MVGRFDNIYNIVFFGIMETNYFNLNDLKKK